MVATETPDTGRDAAPFDFGGLSVTLYRPSDGQALILLDVIELADEGVSDEGKIETINLFSQMLRSLFVDGTERRQVRGMLARDEAGLGEFIGLAEQMMNHWMPEEANRADRRAAEKAKPASTRRPAAKATPRRPASRSKS